MPFNTFNSIQSFIVRASNIITNFFFPNIDISLVLYYPMDISQNINTTNFTANYASAWKPTFTKPVYDASMVGTGAIISRDKYMTGLGDLSLNNATMGLNPATNYVISNQSFNLDSSAGLSISLWFSCNGESGTTGTLISMYQDNNYPSIELDIIGNNNISSGYINNN